MRDLIVLLSLAAVTVGGLLLGVGFIVESALLKFVGAVLLAAVAILGLRGAADEATAPPPGSAHGPHAEPGQHAPRQPAQH